MQIKLRDGTKATEFVVGDLFGATVFQTDGWGTTVFLTTNAVVDTERTCIIVGDLCGDVDRLGDTVRFNTDKAVIRVWRRAVLELGDS